jgi:hypothetical protein
VSLLLNNVSQFVRKKPIPGLRRWRKFAAAKHNVVVNSECARPDAFGCIRSLLVSMHTHRPEVVAETGFHEVAGPEIKRLAG